MYLSLFGAYVITGMMFWAVVSMVKGQQLDDIMKKYGLEGTTGQKMTLCAMFCTLWLPAMLYLAISEKAK
jgi:hypothetical protein